MFIVSKKGRYTKEEWIRIVESHPNVISIHEFENSEIKSYGYAIIKIDSKVFGRYLWDWENGKIDLEINKKYLPNSYKIFENIASENNGVLYYNSKELFDSKRHLPIPQIVIDRKEKYFENHDLDYIRWVAIRGNDQSAVLNALELKDSKQIELRDGIDRSNLVITPSYEGWIFILGDSLPNLLTKRNENSSEEALKNLCTSIQKLSKKFIEVQYFEHQGKSNITGYFKANNGKLQFGYWKSETEEFSKGRVPKEIKKLHPTSAHEVASIWSVDPLDFIYLVEMAEEKSCVVDLF